MNPKLTKAILVIGASALLALSASASASAAGKKAIWGPSTFAAGNANCPVGVSCSAFPVYSELGVDVYQFRLRWDLIATAPPADPTNPADPAYKWPTEIDAVVAEAGARGIGLAALVERTPAWANAGQSNIVAPTRPEDYGAFLTAAARRYPTVARWMIWGEPNRVDHFLPQGKKAGPRAYSKMLQAAYRGLKGVSSSLVVTGGMVDNGGTVKPPVWIKNMRLPSGKRPKMDEFGQNPFDRRPPRLRNQPVGNFRGLNDIDTLWDEIGESFGHRGAGKPRRLWLSEWTLQTDHGSFAFDFSVSQPEQAKRLTAGYRIANKARYVSGLGWFRLDDAPLAPMNATWGLMTADGARKASFSAYSLVP